MHAGLNEAKGMLNPTNSMSQDYYQEATGIFRVSNGFRRDKLRARGFESPPPLEEEQPNALPVYETSGMLSEMFDFPSGMASTELLDQAPQRNYQAHRPAGESKSNLPSINADSVAAMHLFLMNPQPRSPSSSTSLQGPGAGTFGTSTVLSPPQFTWVPDIVNTVSQFNNPSEIGGVVQSQGLSLSLSSPFPHLEVKDGGLPYYTQAHVGIGSSMGMDNVLRNSKYLKVAQELLEEFCSVGGGQLKKHKFARNKTNRSSNPGGTAGSSSLTKDLRPLTPADRIEHQIRKVKLLAMLDEVERRYKLYCEQMKMVVDSLDLVMGNGAAAPYTALAQKAMSRHFRSLKDSISAQLKRSIELLGEKDGAAGISGITKGETPGLRMLEKSLRQQSGFCQMGGSVMEHEPWRPQRGLPERSVNILRAWLFEHFLHPYPSDADKHLLARRTGLSRNQVSNWFINARVRLWKPMVEEMYQQETKEEEGDNNEREKNPNNSSSNAQTSLPSTAVAASTTITTTPAGQTCTFQTTTASKVVAPPISEAFTTTNAGDVSLTLGLRHAR